MCRLSWNLGASTSWNPLGLFTPVMGLLYLMNCDWVTDWSVWSSNPDKGNTILSSPKTFRHALGGPNSLLFNGYPRLKQWSGRGMMLTTHFHLAPRLRISGTTPVLLPHALMAFKFTFYWRFCVTCNKWGLVEIVGIPWKYRENYLGTNRDVRRSQTALLLSRALWRVISLSVIFKPLAPEFSLKF